MALTGHLSDLSLSELIEFFCNQRKSGRLKVLYPQGPGYFYLQSGSVVDARIGVARGIDAVYYALTLPNAKFEFNGSVDTLERTINQPWTQVVLEGLRRLDEGVTPPEAFPEDYQPEPTEPEFGDGEKTAETDLMSPAPGFLSFIGKESISKRRPLFAVAVVVAVLGSVAAVGVPAGWYSRPKASAAVSLPVKVPAVADAPSTSTDTPAVSSEASAAPSDAAAEQAAKRQRERERAKREEKAAAANQSGALSPDTSTAPPVVENKGAKKVAVTVTYDESGRVIQATGGDPSAIRIARQKRFPPGKAGSATITIPIN